MNNEIWNWMHDEKRTALMVLCGWTNSKGCLTPMGRRISRANWFDLSEAARNVITAKFAGMPQ